MRRLIPIYIFFRSILVFTVVWWVIASLIDNQTFLPTPLQVAERGLDLAASGVLLEHIFASVPRFIGALIAAIIVGVPLGLLIGTWQPAKKSLYVLVEIFRPIPAIAWIPIGLLIFGIGYKLPVFIIFYAAVFTIIINTTAGVQSVKNSYIDVARVQGASKTNMLFHVLLPGSLPGTLMGIRISLGLGWMAIIAAEMMGSTSGLGFLITSQRSVSQTGGIIFGMVIIAMLGYAIDLILRVVYERLVPWIGKEA